MVVLANERVLDCVEKNPKNIFKTQDIVVMQTLKPDI